MRLKLSLTYGLIICAAIGVVLSAPSGASAALWTRSVADEAARFRAAFGFPPNVPADASMGNFGVPLSSAEEANLEDRLAKQELLDPFMAYVNEHGDQFGGAWLDQTSSHGNGFVVVLNVVPGAAVAEAAKALELLPAGVARRLVEVRFPLNDLRDTATALANVSAVRGLDGVRLSEVSIDESADRVRVGVVDAQDLSKLEAFNPGIVGHIQDYLVPASCNPQERCTFLPYRGGLQILGANPQFYQCTSGFWAKKSGAFYIITAAHCDEAPSSVLAYRNDLQTSLGIWENDSINLSSCGSTCPANTETYRVLVDSGLVPLNGRNCVYQSATTKCLGITTYAYWAVDAG